MPAAGSKAASSVAGHPCPGREASQAWDVFEMREKPKTCCLHWQGLCEEWTGNTVIDSPAELPESHWLLRCKARGELLTSGSGGKACLQMSKPSIIKKKMTLTLKQAEQRTSFSGWSSEENRGGMSSFN